LHPQFSGTKTTDHINDPVKNWCDLWWSFFISFFPLVSEVTLKFPIPFLWWLLSNFAQ
jgi:hypothetical protein